MALLKECDILGGGCYKHGTPIGAHAQLLKIVQHISDLWSSECLHWIGAATVIILAFVKGKVNGPCRLDVRRGVTVQSVDRHHAEDRVHDSVAIFIRHRSDIKPLGDNQRYAIVELCQLKPFRRAKRFSVRAVHSAACSVLDYLLQRVHSGISKRARGLVIC